MLPYQLGYHPGPSVVVTVLSGTRLGLVQRHDLVADPLACTRTATRAIALAAREAATSVIVLAHEDAAGDSEPLSVAMVEAALTQGLGVHERVVVRDGRWYSPDCHDTCCPDDGHPLPRPEDVPAVAAFVHAGVAPLPSRDALVEGVLPPPDEERAASVGRRLATVGTHSWLDRGEEVLDWWSAVLDPDPQAGPVADLSDEALAWLATSLQDVAWRDALMGILCPGTVPLDGADGPVTTAAALAADRCPWGPGTGPGDCHEEILLVRSRLVALTRLLPEEATPPVLCLVAHIAWWTGDGTVAGVCLEQALAVDPDHRLAHLMMQLLSAGVRPWDHPVDGAGTAA